MSLSFIRIEKEKFVFENRSADGSAENVTVNVFSLNSGAIIDKRVSRTEIRTFEIKSRAAKIIRAAFCGEGNLRSRRATLRGVRIRSRHAKFFDRFGCNAKNGIQSGRQISRAAGLLIVDVNAVERDIRLLVTSAVHITFAGHSRL